MFLRRLQLRNLKSIEELDMSFLDAGRSPRTWSYLLGQNGVGKSALLRAIALVTAGSEALAEIVGEPSQWIRAGQDSASIEMEFATSKNIPRKVKLVIRRGAGVSTLLDDNKRQLQLLDRAIAHTTRSYFIVGYGVSRRRSNDALSFGRINPYRNSRSQNVATLFSGDAALVSLEQWAMDLDYRRGRKGLVMVRNSLNSMMPGVKFVRVDKQSRQLRFRTSDDKFPLAQLSDGYQSMAAWCGDILYRISETFADYSNPLTARGVLLLDEIDLHLHPLWQRQLARFLTRTLPNFQVIATTHSPITAHQAGKGELFVLHRPSPRSAARLVPYDGAPNELSLSQVIQSPIFGIQTLDSVKVSGLRDKFRKLKNLPEVEPMIERSSSFAPPDADASAPVRIARIKDIEEKLKDLGGRDAVPEYMQPTNQLLNELKTTLLDIAHEKSAVKKKAKKRIPKRKMVGKSKSRTSSK